MNQLSPSARRLFELARGQDEPDELARTRVLRALSVRIATDVGLTAAGALAAKSVAAGMGSFAAKATLVVGMTGALVAGGMLTAQALRPAGPPAAPPKAALVARPVPAPAPEAEPPAEPATPPPAEALREPLVAPAARKPARSVAQPEAPLPPATVAIGDRLRAETEALRLAQQALRDKLPQQAIRLLDEQDLHFRDGLLNQERAAARVLALCQAGRVGDARAQAQGFERRWPRSALLGRVRSACWTP